MTGVVKMLPVPNDCRVPHVHGVQRIAGTGVDAIRILLFKDVGGLPKQVYGAVL